MRKLTSTLILSITLCLSFSPLSGAAQAATSSVYTVQKGDSISAIAEKKHITEAKLIQLNHLSDPSKLQIGQKLILASQTVKKTAAVKTKPAAVATKPAAAKKYVVKSHDSLSLIARNTGAPVNKIIALNKLKDPTKLSVGQVLLIPQVAKTTIASRSDDRRTSAGDNDQASVLIAYGKTLIGTPYHYSATGPNAYDCSGFTMTVFKKIDISLPHSSAQQSGMGSAVAKADLQPGDLVFFDTSGSGVSHVGIYVGSGNFMHASTNQGVTITALESTYYASRYVKARRII